ncbi:hypothetical protein R4P64_27085 [Rhodococcus sp. IEGM 1366]|uniref:type VII secretion target n=1 Tax=Rhodococcus sp. IEGM 1366 TaxID=3082223 RepID=UPI0029533C5E|nr:type VII secretion target [Rhodococcus sp. IEGM 1366]MDV8070200.1 hypothetical protein [Rhodococcus sp. IEGM 1366]
MAGTDALRSRTDARDGDTGDAARTHAALWAEWVDSARQVAGALTEDAGLLHQAATEYRRTDDQNAGSISGTRLNMDF